MKDGKKSIFVEIVVVFLLIAFSIYFYNKNKKIRLKFFQYADGSSQSENVEYRDSNDSYLSINAIEDLNNKIDKSEIDREERFSIKLENVNLSDLVEFISNASKMGYCYDQEILKGIKTTIVTSTPVTIEMFGALISHALRAHGFTITDPINNVAYITLSDNSIGILTDVTDDNNSIIKTEVFSIENISIKDIEPILRPPLVSKNSSISFIDFEKEGDIPPSTKIKGMIIVTDNVYDVNKIGKLVGLLDSGKIEIISNRYYPKNLTVSELYNLISKTLLSKNTDSYFYIIPRNDVGCITVVGSYKTVDNIMGNLASIDIEDFKDFNTSKSNKHIIRSRRLINSNPEDLIEFIREKANDIKSENESLYEDMKSIRKVENTSTIIYSTHNQDNHDYISSIIDNVESFKQVFIDMLIVAVEESVVSDMSINWSAKDLASANATNTKGFMSNVTDIGPDKIIDAAKGITAGFIGKCISFRGKPIASLDVIAKALAEESTSVIFAQPHLASLSGEKADMFVGNAIPVNISSQSISSASVNGSPGSASTLSHTKTIDVGTHITFTPTVDDNDLVKLDIEQEISSVDALNNYTTTSYPALSVSRTKSCVVVPNDGILVIGGLSLDYDVNKKTGSPCSSSLCGALRSIIKLSGGGVESSKSKRNVMIFIKPTVAKDGKDLEDITIKRCKRFNGGKDLRMFEESMYHRFWDYIESYN